MFDFDKIIDRSNTGSIKYDIYAGRDIIPMWVADMDFAAPPEVIEAIKTRAEHGVLGYTIPQKKLKELIVERMAELYDWEIQPGWILFTAGLVSALNCICRGLCAPGKQVSVFTPIYPPFLEIPGANYCELVKVPMLNDNEYYSIDFDAFDQSLNADSGMLMLSNPHNPTGRAHTRAELEKLADICNHHNVPVISDEIHCELLLDGNVHIPIATLNKEILHNSITLMSPSKTFNIAGLMCGFAIVPDIEMREKVKSIVNKLASHPNVLGYEAAYAAYRYGEPWRKELLAYLTSNRDLINSELTGFKGLKVCSPEATYLSWIDCSSLGVDSPAKYFETLGVGLNDGTAFDSPQCVRLNFGCSRILLEKAIARMKSEKS